MRSETTTLTSPQDGLPLFVRTWLPDGEAKGVVQLAHGMAEHSARYARFARALTDAGYAKRRTWLHMERPVTPDEASLEPRAGVTVRPVAVDPVNIT